MILAGENPIFKIGSFSLMVCILYLATWPMTACRDRRGQGYTPRFEVAGGGRRVLTFGVPGQGFYETSDLLIQYLNDHLDSVTVQTVACGNIDDYQAKLRNGYFDLTIINGRQLLSAEGNGYRVVGRIADDSRTVIFVHKDSGIHRFSDLRGRTISIPGKNTLAGAMMPLLFLYRQGVDVNGDLRRTYFTSFESAMLNVYLGHASLGATWKPMWEMYLRQRPEIASKLEARWETPPLVNAGVLFRFSIDSNLAAKLAGLFFQMGKDEQSRRALQRLKISGFAPADSTSFRPMEAFLKEYEAVIQ
jgi:phosphonate transport system substrate-binding protein